MIDGWMKGKNEEMYELENGICVRVFSSPLDFILKRRQTEITWAEHDGRTQMSNRCFQHWTKTCCSHASAWTAQRQGKLNSPCFSVLFYIWKAQLHLVCYEACSTHVLHITCSAPVLTPPVKVPVPLASQWTNSDLLLGMFHACSSVHPLRACSNTSCYGACAAGVTNGHELEVFR
jgi:hypothetical protein